MSSKPQPTIMSIVQFLFFPIKMLFMLFKIGKLGDLWACRYLESLPKEQRERIEHDVKEMLNKQKK